MESQNDFEDEYVKKIQEFVRHIKQDREMEEKYMLLEELLKDERKLDEKKEWNRGGIQECQKFCKCSCLNLERYLKNCRKKSMKQQMKMF